MAEIWKGAPVAARLTEELQERVEVLKAKGVEPVLAILRVGERPGDLSYETGAMKRCAKVGIAVRPIHLPEDCGKEQLLDAIRQVNEDRSVHGCLMLRPLADREAEAEACGLLDPEKDVDCMTAGSLAAVFSGNGTGYPPCTAQACMEILAHYGVKLSGKRVTVIGRSLVVGKPVAMMLQAQNATVTMCHTRTVDLPGTCRNAEVLLVAAGRAGIVTKDCTSPGQVVVDVGVNVDENGKLCGDVKFDEVEPLVSAITPVPGGVGAVTTAVLCKHVVEATERASSEEFLK